MNVPNGNFTSAKYTIHWALGTVGVIALLVLAYHIVVKPEAQAAVVQQEASQHCHWTAIVTQGNQYKVEFQNVKLFTSAQKAAEYSCAVRAVIQYGFEKDAAALYCQQPSHYEAFMPSKSDAPNIVTSHGVTQYTSYVVLEAC